MSRAVLSLQISWLAKAFLRRHLSLKDLKHDKNPAQKCPRPREQDMPRPREASKLLCPQTLQGGWSAVGEDRREMGWAEAEAPAWGLTGCGREFEFYSNAIRSP